MSHEILKKNLEFLMKHYNVDVNTLEKKAGVRKNNVYNIIKDKSKEPSAELVQSVADVFDLTVKDLLTDSKIYPALTSRDLDLLVSITKNICNELKTENVTVAFHQAISLIREVFDYCYGHDTSNADIKFIKWTIKNKFNKH